MSQIYNWDHRLPPRGIAFNPRGMTASGPPSLTGRTQVWAYDAGFWVAEFPLATLDKGEQINAYRALRAKLSGGANAIRVPAFDYGQAPWPLPGGWEANLIEDGEFSDGTLFTDGTGFFEYAIEVELATAASAGASHIHVTVTTAGTIEEGMLFSPGDRLHVIKEKLGSTSWLIWPPLREDVAQGTLLNFDKPVCRMRLMNEADMDLSLGRLWQAQPTAMFIEQF